jgi:small subunit ribosomal protein S2
MEKVLGGIAAMNRTPSAIFMVDISHEHIALAEAKRLGITTFGMVDTNSDPNLVDFAIPSNDDATKSIAIITNYITAAIIEGLQERETEKDKMEDDQEEGLEEVVSEEGNAAEGDAAAPRRRASGTRRTTADK